MKERFKTSSFILLLLLTIPAAAAPRYVATVPPLAAILRELVGSRGEVITLLPVGASEHTYQPRPSDARAVESATCLFYVSEQMDGWAASLTAKKKVDVFTLVPAEARLTYAVCGHPHGAHEHSHGPGEGREEAPGLDPHFWLDPVCVKLVLPKLAQTLGECDPQGTSVYDENARRFGEALDALHARLGEILAPVKGKPVLLFHPSFQYFLKRYGLVLAGVIEPFPGKEPTPRYLKAMIEQVRGAGVKAVFTEPQLPSRPAEVIAEAAGVPVYTLDPIGGGEGRAALADLLLYNARILREALK